MNFTLRIIFIILLMLLLLSKSYSSTLMCNGPYYNSWTGSGKLTPYEYSGVLSNGSYEKAELRFPPGLLASLQNSTVWSKTKNGNKNCERTEDPDIIICATNNVSTYQRLDIGFYSLYDYPYKHTRVSVYEGRRYRGELKLMNYNPAWEVPGKGPMSFRIDLENTVYVGEMRQGESKDIRFVIYHYGPAPGPIWLERTGGNGVNMGVTTLYDGSRVDNSRINMSRLPGITRTFKIVVSPDATPGYWEEYFQVVLTCD